MLILGNGLWKCLTRLCKNLRFMGLRNLILSTICCRGKLNIVFSLLESIYLKEPHPKCASFSTRISHPVLGWLYVFSLFPPCPPPQKLFPLMSKPFELNLWYLAQRIYGSREMHWMTFQWLWPKVTAVASISKNLLVCAIKWEPLIGSLPNVAALLP